ncbi:MAG TPA: HDOD domain-containing protein [Candidatus Sulfotelmatobacter sp.]|nr:HDOD domain-containing protein [Candidatus Sulfotelmatobacter sp.]
MTTQGNPAFLLSRIEALQQIPTIPAVLAPLLRYLQQPAEQVDIQKITDMIAQDKSLAAQCLQMANSPLYGRWQKVDSLKGAIVGLGMHRISDIVMSCGVLNLAPRSSGGVDPVAFWEHSLGCALVCRHFARKISFVDPGKAYLAGLLHDIGIIVNLLVLPKEFGAAVERAREQGIPLDEAERSLLGFTHCDSGRLLAEKWELPTDLCAVVGLHHAVTSPSDHAALIALVAIGDLLCRMSGLNHGFVERREVNLLEQPGFSVLAQQYPALRDFDWARLTFELDSYMDEVHSLVHAIYRK